MTTITVHASREYNVDVGKGLLAGLGSKARGLCPRAGTVMLVTDSRVDTFYGRTAEDNLAAAGFRVERFTFPAGEASKNTRTYLELIDRMALAHMTRTDLCVALGGGVTGDLTGFAAATYLRGIPFLQVPTTVLAMVDASVGGKTAVDLEAGKNLLGAFWQPVGVLCDTSLLSTLPEEIFVDGCAEILKYALIGDPELYEDLRSPFRDDPERIIARCVQDKRDVVEEDERDTGRRQLLNYGHTFGHAIEKCSDYAVSHGSAVAIGMCMAARAAAAFGLCPGDVPEKTGERVRALGLPDRTAYSARELALAAMSDKKRAGDRISLVIPDRMCHVGLHPVPAEELEDWFKKGL